MSLRQRNFDVKVYDSRELMLDELLELIPDSLYKYYPPGVNLFKTFETSQIYYSSPNAFNDPFDCRVNINFGNDKNNLLENFSKLSHQDYEFLKKDEELLEIFEDPQNANHFLSTVLIESLNSAMGISCFSEISESPLMWAHYANSHQGVCLKFDTSKESFIRNNLIPVQYYEQYPEFVMDNFNIDEVNIFFLQYIASKGDDWDYEFEWRSITEQGGDRMYAFEKELLTGVIFGMRSSDEFISNTVKTLQENEYPNVKFYQASMSPNAYRIEINEMK